MSNRPSDGRNEAKTRDQAKTSKKDVALAQVAQRDAWLKKLQSRIRKIDQDVATLEKAAKALEVLTKKQEDNAKLRELIEHLVHHVSEEEHEVVKEAQTHAEIRVSEKPPKVPHGHMTAGPLLAVAFTVIGFWKVLKSRLK